MKLLPLIMICIGTLFIVNAAAQEKTAGLKGFVTKLYGEAAPKTQVTIDLKSSKKKFSRKVLTDSKGSYSFADIPVGTYAISASDASGMTYLNENFTIAPNRTSELNFVIEYGGDCRKAKTTAIQPSRAEKTRIIGEILSDVLLKESIAESKSLKRQKEGIILATDNLEDLSIKSPKTIKLQFMSEDAVRKKANAERSAFMYLSFRKFKTKGDCFVLTISNLWSTPFNSTNAPTSGGGNIYVYERKGGRLRIKYRGLWNF